MWNMNWSYKEIIYDKLKELRSCFLYCPNLKHNLMNYRSIQVILILFLGSVQIITSSPPCCVPLIKCGLLWLSYLLSSTRGDDTCMPDYYWDYMTNWWHSYLPLCFVIVLTECNLGSKRDIGSPSGLPLLCALISWHTVFSLSKLKTNYPKASGIFPCLEITLVLK